MTDAPESTPNPPASSRLWAVVALGAVGALGLFLAARGRGHGQGIAGFIARDGLAAIGIGLLALLYFAPTLIAWRRQHRDVMALGALNLFLGWSFVGWVIALVWSLRASDRASR